MADGIHAPSSAPLVVVPSADSPSERPSASDRPSARLRPSSHDRLSNGRVSTRVRLSDAPIAKRVPRPGAIVGYFETPAEIYAACERLRDAGYRTFDAHTPFPVHGLERAMGLRPSRLPWVVLSCGALGLVGAIVMQWWMSSVDYPLNISGKPAFSFQAYVPITFELTILLAAFGCFFGMWAMNGLPRFFHPVMQHPDFGRATDDRFFLSVEGRDPRFDAKKTRALFEELGAKGIEEVAP